jgi:hypothetical protein
MEVAYECDVEDNDGYSSDIDELRSFWEVNGVVNMDVSDEIGSLFPVVADAVDNGFVCSIVECV